MVHHDISAQYKTEENLRIRIETHQRYSVGPPLEPAIDKAISLQPEESLLDVGTGPGDFPKRLRRSGHCGRLVGIDSSPGMIAKGKEGGGDVEFFVADAQALPFTDQSFDVVSARHMLYHVPDITLALREAKRVMKPGGRFLAVTNILDNFGDYRRALSEAADRLRGEIADVLRFVVPASDVFNEQNGPSLVRDIFGNVNVALVEAALRFESGEPALRYFDSCRTMKRFNEQEWAVARQTFAEIILKRLDAGPWMVSKTVALLSAKC